MGYQATQLLKRQATHPQVLVAHCLKLGLKWMYLRLPLSHLRENLIQSHSNSANNASLMHAITSKKVTLKCQVEQIVQRFKCLLYKHEDMTLDGQYPHASWRQH